MLGLGLNKLGRAIRSVFDPANLFGLADTGSYYDLDATTQPDTADAYHSTAAIYPVIDDGRGVVNELTESDDITKDAWSKTNVTAPAADLMQASSGSAQHYVQRNSGLWRSTVLDQQVTYQVKIKRGNYDLIQLVAGNATEYGSNAFITIDTSDFSIAYEGSGVYDAYLDNTPDEDDFYLCYFSCDGIQNGSNTNFIVSFTNNAAVRINTFNAAGTETVYLKNAQFNRGPYKPYQYTGPYLNGPAQPIGLLLAGNRDNRGVVNLIPYSNELDQWTKVSGGTGSAPVLTPGQTDRNGGTTAWRLQAERGAGTTSSDRSNITIISLRTFSNPHSSSIGIWAKSNTGLAQTAYFRNATGDGGSTISITTDWQFFSISSSNVASTLDQVQIGTRSTNGDASIDILISEAQLQEKSTDCTADEYQANGPFLGGPGDHMGNATSANRMTYSLLPYGGPTGGATSDLVGYLTGAAGNYFSTPDSAALDITGDIEIICHAALDDWTPSSANTLISKWVGGGNQRSYQFLIFTNGRPYFQISQDGSSGTSVTYVATEAPVVDDGAEIWLKVELDVDDGASDSIATFYTSSDGTNWAQLGDPVAAGSTVSIYSGSANLEIGGVSAASSNQVTGKVYRAIVKDGIGGTVVADFNPDNAGGASRSWVSNGAGGETWTANGNAFLARSDLVYTSVYDMSLPGLPQIPYEYGDGSSDFHTLGKEYFGLKQDGLGVVNLLKFSQQFNAAASDWVLTRSTLTAESTTAPDGTTTGYALLQAAGQTTAGNVKDTSFDVVAGDYVISIYAKPNGKNFLFIRESMADGTENNTWFNLSSGAVGTNDAAHTAAISAESNGWYRCSIKFTVDADRNGAVYFFLAESDASSTVTDDQQGIYIWGAQIEQSSTLSAYQANSYTLGGSLGTAGLFCDPTQQWSVGFACLTSSNGKYVVSKRGATTTDATFSIAVNSSGYLQVVIRGTSTVFTGLGVINDMRPHVGLVTWDGNTPTVWLDRNGLVGIAAGDKPEETQNITWFVRTESSPTGWWTGYGLPLLMEARALTASEATQFMNYHCNRIGVEA